MWGRKSMSYSDNPRQPYNPYYPNIFEIFDSLLNLHMQEPISPRRSPLLVSIDLEFTDNT